MSNDERRYHAESSNARSRHDYSPPSVFRACEACAKAKTRCERVTSFGCARCRRMQRGCSLAGVSSSGKDYTSDRRDVSPPRHHRRSRDSLSPDQRYQSFSSGSSHVPDRRHHYQATVRHSNDAQHRLQHLEGPLLIDPFAPSISQSDSIGLSPRDTASAPIPTISSSGPSHQSSFSSGPSAWTKAIPPSPNDLQFNRPTDLSIRLRSPDISGFKKGLLQRPGSIAFNETALCIVDVNNYPDVLERGLLSRSRVDMAFTLFKHRFSQIAPLIPFLLTTRSRPKHPFVTLAALAFVENVLPVAGVGMIEESIMYALTGAVSMDVVLSLYILSYASFLDGSEKHVPSTSLRLASLAYSIGLDLGLETRAKLSLGSNERAEELLAPWSSEQLENLTLWEAVKNRYAILSLQYTRCRDLPTLFSARIPAHPADHIRHCVNHLQAESRIVDTCRDFVREIADSEVDAHRHWPEIPDLYAKWGAIQVTMRILRPEIAPTDYLLLFQTYSVPMNLGLRFTLLAQAAPIPLDMSIIARDQAISGSAWFVAAKDLLYDFVPTIISPTDNDEIDRLPTCAMTALAACLAALRVISIVTRNMNPPLIDVANLQAAEMYFANLGGLPGRVMKEMWPTLYDPPAHLVEKHNKDNESANAAADPMSLTEEEFCMGFLDLEMLFSGGVVSNE